MAKNDSYNRLMVVDDWKKQVIDLASSNFVVPAVDIYDEPVRYYKANLQWTPIIEGILSWLTEVTAWQNANDDSHAGIQAILKFLEGVDIVQLQLRWNNCVLESSTDGIVWTPVTGYDANCFVSDTELTNAVDGLQSQIDSNDTDIAGLISQVNTNTGNIASNASNISNLINITDDHETRITDLENATPPATGSGGVYEEISTQLLQSDGQFTAVDVSGYRYWKATLLVASNTASEAWLNATITPVGIVNSTLLANSALVAIMSSANIANSGMYTQVIIECEGSCFERSKSLNSIYNKPSGGGSSPTFNGHNMQSWLNEPIDTINFTPNTGLLLAGSFLSIVGILCDDGLDLPELPSGQERIIVDFDGGYSNYTLPVNVPPNAPATIQAGGVTGNCAGTTSDGTAMLANSVYVDIPSGALVKRVEFSYQFKIQDPDAGVEYQIREWITPIDGGGNNMTHLVDTGWMTTIGDAWTKVTWNGSLSGADIIAVANGTRSIPGDGSTLYDLKIDNIVIDYEP